VVSIGVSGSSLVPAGGEELEARLSCLVSVIFDNYGRH
jgi:hypothetical protein